MNKFAKNGDRGFPIRYVDDIFAIIPNRLIQDALKLLNIQDNSLKFTLETEIDDQLPFLNLKIKRNPDRLTFGIYRKPTHTENYINSIGKKVLLHFTFNCHQMTQDWSKMMMGRILIKSNVFRIHITFNGV